MRRIGEKELVTRGRVRPNKTRLNPLTPNDLHRRRDVCPLKIKIPSKKIATHHVNTYINAYINKMHGSSKIPNKKSRQAGLRGGI
jgi:hypothetical protein